MHGNLWMGKVWNFIFPTKYVCNHVIPKSLKFGPLAKTYGNKKTYPLKLGPEREKTLHPWGFFKKKRFMIQEIHKLQQKIASSLMGITHWYFSRLVFGPGFRILVGTCSIDGIREPLTEMAGNVSKSLGILIFSNTLSMFVGFQSLVLIEKMTCLSW